MSKRRRRQARRGAGRQARRGEKLGAILRQRFGAAPLDLCFFAPSSIEPPTSAADLPLALWKLQVGLEIVERKARGALHCIVCDNAITVVPPLVGFIRADDPNSDLCGFAVCESCFGGAETLEELSAMISAAVGGTLAPAPPCN
jgi:hypothetical protein